MTRGKETIKAKVNFQLGSQTNFLTLKSILRAINSRPFNKMPVKDNKIYRRYTPVFKRAIQKRTSVKA